MHNRTLLRHALFAWALRIIIAVLVSSPLQAQDTGQSGTITVATRVLPPFIIKDGDSYTGFSAALWEYIAQDAGLAYSWKETANIKAIIAEVEAGKADAAIAAISITAERESRFDFSQPIFESGLQVMVHEDAGGGGFSLSNIRRILSSGALPAMLGLLAALVLIPAHVVWLAERKHGNPLFATRYIPGIFHAIWWAVGATAGQQPDIPRSGLGRLLSAISIMVSVIFLAFFTAALTASITVNQLQGDIQGPGDLTGKRVGTTVASTTFKYLSDHGILAREYEKIADAFHDLEQKNLDAVVFDAPVLLYYAANEGRNKVRVVGPIFRRENYGIMFPAGSPLRKKVNAALLKMREDGSYDRLYERWFAQQDGD
jgi:polar amino acid transport system substrate-binding protein